MADEAPDGACDECGEFMDAEEVNVEAFELTGKILCEACAAEAMEEPS